MSAWRLFLIVMPTLVCGLSAQAASDDRKFDLSKDKVLYCVGYAHLDTQWRWDFCTTIDRYIRDTLEQNFERFDKYPGYVFNFTGSVRYEMMREYYPEHYARLKKYIADGRWLVSGSSVDEGDVNVPGAETVIRHVLYGNQFFRREFGKESLDFMLPDCFGFPASMPSIWAHCGLKGFSTQKLTWGSAVGIPFKIGVWEGPDGRDVIAAFDPGPYVGAIEGRVDTNPEWVARVNANGEKYGVFADYHYYGVGDQGGAPKEEDIRNYLDSIDKPDSQIHVALTSSDQMYKDITAEQKARLPRYKGDLLLTEHSAGTLTSQAYMKRWNRKNEQLADAAERAAVMANWLGGTEYPREKLYKSWVRLLANQMHDILPGTSIPRAYTYSWNDEIIASNGFAAVLTDSIGAISRALDTRVQGTPLVVYNPLAIARTDDLVEADVTFAGAAPPAVRVYDAEGNEAPSQILSRASNTVRVLFLARLSPVSVRVYDVRPADRAYAAPSALRIGESELENENYRVTLNPAGDVAQVLDKAAGGRALLAEPAQLVFTHERPRNFPAWNMDWADRQKPPIDVVKGPAKVTIVERGPVRVSLRVERTARDSIVTQEIRLSSGMAGRRVELKTEIDWQSSECTLKAAFPLTVSNPNATYNWEVGTIARGNNQPTKYEVPSHHWFDLTDKSGEYGVSVLEDSKYGSDKPNDNTLRLTLLYTPGVRKSYLDQHSQDWGRHDMTYALYGHSGDWRTAHTEWHARTLNQPMRVFQAEEHEGRLGREFSCLRRVSTPQVDLRAMKRAEESDHMIVRLQELWGRPAENVELVFAAPISEAYEVDGQERPIGDAAASNGKLRLSMSPHGLRSFAIRLSDAPTFVTRPICTAVALPLNADVASRDSARADGGFDSEGRTLPAEELPRTITSEGVVFHLGPTGNGEMNAVSCRGQTVSLPRTDAGRLFLLAAASEDTQGDFLVGDVRHTLNVQSWTGFIGQWDNREWDRPFEEVDSHCEGKVTGIQTGFIKRDTLAWFCSHRHHPTRGNEAYQFSYLCRYALPVMKGASTLTLPDNPKIHVLAATLVRGGNDVVRPAAPLYDDFTDRRPIEFRHRYPPPPRPVFDGVAQAADVAIDRRDDFESLKIAPPSKTDDADRSESAAMRFGFFNEDGDHPPHHGSGAEDGWLPRLNDGEFAQNADDTQRCVWFDNQGRFYVDLKRSTPVACVNTYSWHRANRAPQYFSLWASNAESMPPPDFTHAGQQGWTLLAVVDTRPLGDGGVHASSVHCRDGRPLGPFRHLLWIAEDVGEGTFFTEIDVHVPKP